jgi:hypothetical protein
MRHGNFGLMRRASVAGMVLAVCCGLMSPVAAPAQHKDVDYAKLFLERGLKCIHPTAKPDTARVEVLKGPEVKGDISATRLRVYYSGMVKKHTMDVEVLVREAGSIRQMKLNVLADSGMEVGSCDLTKNWADF